MARYTQDFFAYFGGKQVYKATGAYFSKEEGHAQAKQIYLQLAKTNSYGYLTVCIVSKYPTECYDGKSFGAQPPPPAPKPPPEVKCPPGTKLIKTNPGDPGTCSPVLPSPIYSAPKPTSPGPITTIFPFFPRPRRVAGVGRVQWSDSEVGRRQSTPVCPPGFYFSSRFHSCVPGVKPSDPSLHGLGEGISFKVTKPEEVNEAKKDLAVWGSAYPTLHPTVLSYTGAPTAPIWTHTDEKMLVAFAEWWNADPKHTSKLTTTGVLETWHLFSLRAFVESGGKTSPYTPGGGGQTVPQQPGACPPGQVMDASGKCVVLVPLPLDKTEPATPPVFKRQPGGAVAPVPATTAPKSETPWGWIIGGVALAGVAGLAIWSGARGVGGGIGEARDNPAPAKMIYWKDIGPEDVVTLEGKPRSQYYVVRKPSGKKFLAHWGGQEAREAQRWLESRVRRAPQKLAENPTRRVGGVLVRTDDKWRDFVYGYDVPEKVRREDFDWVDDAEGSDHFFKYHDTWYHLSQFTRTAGGGAAGAGIPTLEAAGWQGIHEESISTGVVIKVSDNGEQYKVGSYRTAPT